MWIHYLTIYCVTLAVASETEHCFVVDNATGKQLCCPVSDGDCAEYLPKTSLNIVDGFQTLQQYNTTNPYFVSPPENNDASCCCLEEKERLLLETVVAEGGETFEVAHNSPNLVQPIDSIACRQVPCILSSSHSRERSKCSQIWASRDVYVKDPSHENQLRIITLKVPNGCLCGKYVQHPNRTSRSLIFPTTNDVELGVHKGLRSLLLSAGEMGHFEDAEKVSKTLVKRQADNQEHSMSTAKMLTLILNKVEGSERMPVFQVVERMMGLEVEYMKEAGKITDVMFGSKGNNNQNSLPQPQEGKEDEKQNQEEDEKQNQEEDEKQNQTEDEEDEEKEKEEEEYKEKEQKENIVKVKLLKYLLKRAMSEAICSTTDAGDLEDHSGSTFLTRKFLKQLRQNKEITISSFATMLVSTAVHCKDTDVLAAIKDGRLARMIVAAEMVSENLAKVITDHGDRLKGMFESTADNAINAPLGVLDENKVEEIQNFFDKILETSGINDGESPSSAPVTTTPESTLATKPSQHSSENSITESTSLGSEYSSELPLNLTEEPPKVGTKHPTDAPLSQDADLALGTTIPSTSTSPIISGQNEISKPFNSSIQSEYVAVIPPEELLPSSEFLSFNDTGEVLNSILGNDAFVSDPSATVAPVTTEPPATVAPATESPVTAEHYHEVPATETPDEAALATAAHYDEVPEKPAHYYEKPHTEASDIDDHYYKDPYTYATEASDNDDHYYKDPYTYATEASDNDDHYYKDPYTYATEASDNDDHYYKDPYTSVEEASDNDDHYYKDPYTSDEEASDNNDHYYKDPYTSVTEASDIEDHYTYATEASDNDDHYYKDPYTSVEEGSDNDHYYKDPYTSVEEGSDNDHYYKDPYTSVEEASDNDHYYKDPYTSVEEDSDNDDHYYKDPYSSVTEASDNDQYTYATESTYDDAEYTYTYTSESPYKPPLHYGSDQVYIPEVAELPENEYQPIDRSPKFIALILGKSLYDIFV